MLDPIEYGYDVKKMKNFRPGRKFEVWILKKVILNQVFSLVTT